MADNLLESET